MCLRATAQLCETLQTPGIVSVGLRRSWFLSPLVCCDASPFRQVHVPQLAWNGLRAANRVCARTAGPTAIALSALGHGKRRTATHPASWLTRLPRSWTWPNAVILRCLGNHGQSPSGTARQALTQVSAAKPQVHYQYVPARWTRLAHPPVAATPPTSTSASPIREQWSSTPTFLDTSKRRHPSQTRPRNSVARSWVIHTRTAESTLQMRSAFVKSKAQAIRYPISVAD